MKNFLSEKFKKNDEHEIMKEGQEVSSIPEIKKKSFLGEFD